MPKVSCCFQNQPDGILAILQATAGTLGNVTNPGVNSITDVLEHASSLAADVLTLRQKCDLPQLCLLSRFHLQRACAAQEMFPSQGEGSWKEGNPRTKPMCALILKKCPECLSPRRMAVRTVGPPGQRVGRKEYLQADPEAPTKDYKTGLYAQNVCSLMN